MIDSNWLLWKNKTLGDVSVITMGQSPSSISYNEDGIGNYLIQGNADIKNRKSLPRQWTSEPTKFCDVGDTLMTVRAPVGAIAKAVHYACIGRGVCSIKPKNIDNEFLYQFLLSYESKWKALEQGSTFTAVNGTDIKGVNLQLPPLPEQQRIADILSTVDAKIDVISQQITEIQELKKGLMQRLLTKGIGHTEFKDSPLGRIPKSWEVVKIGDVLKLGSGKDYKHLKEGSIPVYGTGGVMTYVNEYLYDGESVGIGRKGTIDKPVYLNGKFWTVDTLFYTHSFSDVIPFYIYVVFQSIDWKKHSEATGVPSLSRTIIEPLKILLPSIIEQTKIADILNSVDEKINILSEKKTTYEELKQGLMQKLLTGKVRVKV